MSDKTLYRITDELLAILHSDDPDQDFTADLDAVLIELKDKVGNCGRAHRMLIDREAMLKARAAEFTAAAKKAGNNAERLKTYVQHCMEAADLDNVTDGDVVAKIKKNPAAVVYAEDFEAPKAYMKPQPDKLDTAGIKAALKDGQEIDGAELVSGFRLELK